VDFIKKISDSCTVGVRRILNSVEPFHKSQKELQREAVRSLLNNMITGSYELNYSDKGKPYVYNHSFYLSISHSHEYAAVIINKNEETGIDIQKVTPKIFKIKNKFVNDKEALCINKSTELEELHIIWGAKEALYKYYGEKGVDFRSEMHIAKFNFYDKNEGILNARLIRNDINKEFTLKYIVLNNYFLVYILPEDFLP
jgi:4'-phosphopantetheinyl transferase